jgi:hypothetical protein
MGLIQKLEATHLTPVASPSCDVMTLLRPANESPSCPGNEGDPAGMTGAAAPEDIKLETMSCVVREGLFKEGAEQLIDADNMILDQIFS